MKKILLRLSVIALAIATVEASAQSSDILHYGVMETLSYPLLIKANDGQATGGLLKDLGDALARELKTSVKILLFPRKRIEPYLHKGNLHLVCFLSPQWVDEPDKLRWSMGTFVQVERAVTLRTKMLPSGQPASFQGKRVATQLGYHYHDLQAMFDRGIANRLDQTRVEHQFKALELGMADVLITSEDEIEGFMVERSNARKIFEVSTFVYSKVTTQCAVSPNSPYSLEQIDSALGRIDKSGELQKMTARYNLSAR